ncbi:Bug family tripartite tricarboxylate transporter substrate binding protein [Rhodoplanes sp. Z2-YC6860]|uniref:Bug family tripartite tricarboxylate transporter substrate binding protein n=1 Tax=Rhodoplanes sp. Z2-YC6860 TaxID=674703 RepID=UPI000A886807|nr:tripartite tricarboxylate transporter substrate binding protein [Rhodoplanes sp. Z2-YC6860]
MMDLRQVKRGLIALLAIVAAATAQAQTFPSKTIRIIVPYAPGGSVDLTARVIAKNLQDSIGQSVIVENKPGANAAIGIDALVRSDPDGHNIIILSDSPVTINVHLAKLNYDPLTDLVPISKVVSSPIMLAANARSGIASIPDLVAAAKAKPLSYAVAGRGSSSNLAAELLQRELGIKMEAVPYRGGAPAATAVAAGDVPLGLFDTAAVLPMIGDGQLVPLGVAEPTRAKSMPNIPTLREAGVPNFSAQSWLALFVPRGTPEDRVARLNAEVARIAELPEAQKVLASAGLELAPNSATEMRRIIETDLKKWGDLIKATGLKAD